MIELHNFLELMFFGFFWLATYLFFCSSRVQFLDGEKNVFHPTTSRKKRGKHSRKIEENPAGVNCYFYSLINFSLENITWVKATLN
jgi:hypothetical protein